MRQITRNVLRTLPVCHFYASSLTLAGDLQFVEKAEEVGIDVSHSSIGYDHFNYTAGGAVGDFNNDGWQDLFVISGGIGAVPDRLFINNGDGTFTNEAAAWGLTAVHKGKGASVGDFNHDGWLDIYETSAGSIAFTAPGQHRLYRNNGNGTFTNIAVSAGVNSTHPTIEDGFGSTWGDYDLDGDLDLFVAGFAPGNSGNRLFRNNGDATFTDVTSDIGFFAGTPISMSSFSPRFLDTDGDWYPEMLLVSDFGTSRYFRNNGDGTFTDWTAPSDTSQEENGMGNTFGDFNNDGRIDWYVSSIHLPSIGWTGNKLYLNQGGHQFDEVAQAKGVHDGGYGWACLGIDFNHDTLLDIAETNGDSSGAFGGAFFMEQSYLWIQESDGTFDEVAVESGFIHNGKGRGMVNFDYDNDGDQDIALFSNNEPLFFFENQLAGESINWLRVFLDTSDEPTLAPWGHNAHVTATFGETSLLRVINSGDNFLSHSELSAHYGLGDATSVDELLVEWPNGETTVLEDVAANQTITITYGDSATPGDLDEDGDVDFADLLGMLDQWGACEADCPADLDDSGSVGFADLLILLSNWS